MKISFSPYELKYIFQQGLRRGALICCQFENGFNGYADIHPWVEFGDLPLNKQLEQLKQGMTTSLTKRSLFFAKLDAEFRQLGKNIFSGLKIPSSHHLLLDMDEEIPQGASMIKIKLGYSPNIEIERIADFLNKISGKLKIRIDFNNRIDQITLEKYLSRIEPWKKIIDFIEDPISYDQKLWTLLQEKYGIPFASDAGSEKHIQDENTLILILKPAVQDEDLFMKTRKRVVVTTYLDHPIGQLASSYIASKFIEPAGLLSHKVYQTNEFSEHLKVVDNVLVPPKEGTGFGFDNILTRQKWIELT